MEENFLNAVSNIGVPALIAMYVLIRLDERLRMLTESINELSNFIRQDIIRHSPLLKNEG